MPGARSGRATRTLRSFTGTLIRRLEEGTNNMRQAVIYPDEDGGWVAECPGLPGCISQGATREEAAINIKEAIRGYLKVLEEDGLPVLEEKFEAVLVAV